LGDELVRDEDEEERLMMRECGDSEAQNARFL